MQINIFVYWGQRLQDVDECSGLLMRHLRVLSLKESSWSDWIKLGTNQKQILNQKRIDISDALELRKLVMAGRNRKDIGNDVISNLGSRVSLIARNAGAIVAKTGIKCGTASQHLSHDTQNNASVEIYDPTKLSADDLLALFREMIELWQPIWGRVWGDVPVQGNLEREELLIAYYNSSLQSSKPDLEIGSQATLANGGVIWTNERARSFLMRC